MRKLGLALGLSLAGVVYAGDSVVMPVVEKIFQRDVLDYGDAVVLFYGSAPNTEEKRIECDNNRRALYQIAESSQGITRNGHPVKFLIYDAQQHIYQGLSSEESEEVLKEKFDVAGLPSFHIYRDGKLVDTMPCGIRDEGAILATVNNLGQGVIPSIFEGPIDGKVYGYEGTCKIHEIED
ncbi:hypothetical protein HON03_05270 [archaeon]|jgi:hypothetical protein|nr:hypothetical protein [archaeon]MBT5287999.1 hypothetical protein [archaeon]